MDPSGVMDSGSKGHEELFRVLFQWRKGKGHRHAHQSAVKYLGVAKQFV